MRVLLVGEHILFLEGLQSLLQSNGIEVAGTARDGTEALEKARLLGPDVLLINITRSGRGGLDTVRQVKAEVPAVKTIILDDSDENLIAAVQSGACGYLLTNIQGDELLQKLLALEQGEAPFSPGLTARVVEGFALQAAEKDQAVAAAEKGRAGQLTARQNEVLALVARGMTYREAGAALGLTERTVKYHMGRIMKLLRLKKREQVIAYVLQKP